jgi:predicted alpha/beta hydrolase family esterase
VEQKNWSEPNLGDWVAALDLAIRQCANPPLLIAHSLGCITIAHWAATHAANIRGALMVAPSDVDAKKAHYPIQSFKPIPLKKLAFPSLLISSSNDPFMTRIRARYVADAWGSRFIDVGAAGHINTESGMGEWPEGEAFLYSLLAEIAHGWK